MTASVEDALIADTKAYQVLVSFTFHRVLYVPGVKAIPLQAWTGP
jgi:hypothetical protein